MKIYTLLSTLALLAVICCRTRHTYPVYENDIVVDAEISDWNGVRVETVDSKDNLWIGQGMIQDNWLGKHDLSFSWRAAWKGNKLYLLYEVTDDRISPFDRENTWLNDCVEICLDPLNKRGARKKNVNGKVVLRGYETHFLPSQPPHAFLHDHSSVFFTNSPQDDVFRDEWNGEMAVKYKPDGYVMELGFSIPEVKLKKGVVIGFETGICDDDGDGRKNLITWTGIQYDFWITMNKYGQLLVK